MKLHLDHELIYLHSQQLNICLFLFEWEIFKQKSCVCYFSEGTSYYAINLMIYVYATLYLLPCTKQLNLLLTNIIYTFFIGTVVRLSILSFFVSLQSCDVRPIGFSLLKLVALSIHT